MIGIEGRTGNLKTRRRLLQSPVGHPGTVALQPQLLLLHVNEHKSAGARQNKEIFEQPEGRRLIALTLSA